MCLLRQRPVRAGGYDASRVRRQRAFAGFFLDGLAMRFISDRGDLPMIVPGRINTHLTAVICEMTTR